MFYLIAGMYSLHVAYMSETSSRMAAASARGGRVGGRGDCGSGQASRLQQTFRIRHVVLLVTGVQHGAGDCMQCQ